MQNKCDIAKIHEKAIAELKRTTSFTSRARAAVEIEGGQQAQHTTGQQLKAGDLVIVNDPMLPPGFRHYHGMRCRIESIDDSSAPVRCIVTPMPTRTDTGDGHTTTRVCADCGLLRLDASQLRLLPAADADAGGHRQQDHEEKLRLLEGPAPA